MNIITLELEAFGPFAKTCTIDFARTISGGLFLIQGPTGSGKTSILDAICYALYGESSGSERQAIGLRSHHAADDQATRVRLVFASGGKNYQVERWMSGRKSQVPNEKAILQELGPLETSIITDKRSEVSQRITQLIRLDQNQFRQVIVLPQGRFRDFLVAKSLERENILKNLFDTARLDDLVDRIDQRRQKQKTAVEAIRAEAKFLRESLNLITDADPDALQAELSARLLQLETRCQTARLATQAARAQLEKGRKDQEILANLAAAVQNLANLDARKPGKERRLLQEAESLRSLAHLPATLERLDADAQKLSGLLDKLDRQIADRLSRKPRLDARALQAALEHDRIPALREQLSRQRHLRTEMASLDNLRNQLSSINMNLVQANIARAGTESMRTEQTTKRDALQLERRALLEWAELPGAAETIHREILELIRDSESLALAQQECQRLDQELIHFDVEMVRLSGQLELKQSQLQVLEQNYRGQAAARLASQLVADQPCPVCGSPHHPAPAHVLQLDTPTETLETVQIEIASQAAQVQDLALRQAVARESRQNHGAVLDRLAVSIKSHQTLLQATAAEVLAPASRDELAFQPSLPDEYQEFLAAIVPDQPKHAPGAWNGLSETSQDMLRRSQAAQRNASHLERQIASLEEHCQTLRETLHTESAAVAVLEERQRNLSSLEQERRTALATAFGLDHAEFPEIQELDQKIATEESRLVAIEQEREQARQELADLEMANSADSSRRQELVRQSEDLERSRQETRETWLKEIRERGFETEKAALAALLGEPELSALRQIIEVWDQAHLLAHDRLSTLQTQSKGLTQPDLAALTAALDQAMAGESSLERERVLASRELEQLHSGLGRLQTLQHELALAETTLASISGLCKLLLGQEAEGAYVNLQRYALSVYLDDILNHANQHLQDMSRGRYELVREDLAGGKKKTGGLELQILDAYTGSRRGTESLSGGESFLAALALALGLSSVVHARAGGVRIDTLFVDEGFGSLDEEALQDAMTVLGRLNDRGRTVGIISHVRELQERIPLQLVVQRTSTGSQAAWNSLISGSD